MHRCGYERIMIGFKNRQNNKINNFVTIETKEITERRQSIFNYYSFKIQSSEYFKCMLIYNIDYCKFY